MTLDPAAAPKVANRCAARAEIGSHVLEVSTAPGERSLRSPTDAS